MGLDIWVWDCQAACPKRLSRLLWGIAVQKRSVPRRVVPIELVRAASPSLVYRLPPLIILACHPYLRRSALTRWRKRLGAIIWYSKSPTYRTMVALCHRQIVRMGSCLKSTVAPLVAKVTSGDGDSGMLTWNVVLEQSDLADNNL